MVKHTQSNREDWSGQWKSMAGITAMLVILFTAASVNAQTYTPLRYWTFENTTNAMKDSSNNFNMDPNYYASPYTINTNASNVGVGRYLSLNSNSGLIKLGTLSIDTAFTVEFLFRPGYLFNTTVLFRRLDDAFDASMGYPYIYFNSTTNNYAGGVTSDIMKVDLNLIGRRSYGYFMDGNWHHMVFKYNSKTGLKQIWVDGECADGYSKTIAPGYFTNTTSTNKDVILNTNVAHVKYNGDYDEMALYTYALPDNQIYKHYQDFVQKQHYTYAASATAAPAPSPVTAPLDVNEFAPGHPSVTISAVDQIAQFPTPRFKPGHTLLQNFNWMDPAYMGGLFQPGVTTTQAALNSTVIQKELAKNFNYYFILMMDNSQFDTAWVGAANRDPSLKLGIVTFRAQINSNNPDLKSQTKPTDHYLQNSSGQYIDVNGNVTSNKIWRPTAPTSSYTSDGNNILSRFNNLFSRLNRGIDWVNENGEVFPFPSESAMSKDPVVTAAKNASGLDWPTFLARKYKENETQSYRNVFMAHSRLANAKFTEFGHEGYPPIYGFKYSESRQAGSLINNQYYPTTSFYTRYPYNWRNWTSAWHGWQWIVESRVNELAVGDRLYSPFVAAGWDGNEELNIRPAQWLGLMKSLGMTGAEFYYAAFFSIVSPQPDPKNWVWQAVVPSYAQAITSRYEDYLRNGELMTGDVPNNFINPTGPGYSFWAGDLRKLVVVRKHNAANKYAITGTLQPNSSMTGNAENESVAKITLDGQLISFKVRRQGSTYIYDKSNPAAPVFYQLDGWHEATHPSRWTRDFNIEAELFDNTNANAVIRTTVPAGTTAGDYTNHTSYVSFSTASDVTYNFQPRPNAPATQYLWVRARSKSGASAGFTAQFNSGTVHTFNCITDTNWVWYRYNTSNVAVSISGLSTTTINVLKITAINTLIEIDKIAITSNSTAVYGNAGNACTGVQATITASGPTSFCQGGSVNLTANSGSSYLWSNGSTTQAITVTSSGSYTVTVTTTGVGTAISSPVTVTVNALPVATISASGSISFCQGGSVTLTASSDSSYLWSPGNQTTQAVTITAGGAYNVRVTNSNGCSKVSSNTTVTVNALPTATVTAGGPVTFCQGGSVTLTSSSGSSYLWSPGNQTTQSISATSGGTYSVRVTNSSGCTKVSSNTIVTVNSLPTATITASGPLNLSTGGSVTLTASAGSSYLWLPGNQTTQSITVNTAGSYTVRVTNSSGCSNTSAAAVVTVGTTVPATITTSGHTSFCQGGSVTLTASSGTSYLWSNGSTAKSITVSASGTYSVTVYNGSTPSVSPAVSVTVWPLPTATITASGATSFCTGGSVTLTASSNSSYYWTPGGQTSQSITVTASGTYNVTVTNSNGCTKTASAVPVVVSSCTTCDPPYGLVTSNVSATSATFSWVHPNTGQTQYNVKFKNMTTGYVYVTGKLSYTNNLLTIGVDAGTNYRWWVRSWCGSFTSSAYAGYLSFSTPLARVANAPQVDPVDITEAYLDPENDQDPAMTVYLNEKEVQIFPNPATTSASITFSIQQKERMTLSIMEANGKLISTDVIEAAEGFNIHEMDLGNLPKGMYMVQLTGNGNTTTKRLAVQ